MPSSSRPGIGRSRHDLASAVTDHRVVHRHVSPSENPQALAADDLLDVGHDLLGVGLGGRQERHADGVLPRRRQREVDDRPEEAIRDLDRDAGAVARVRLGPLGAAMLEVAERADPHGDDLVGGSPFDVDDERHAACNGSGSPARLHGTSIERPEN